MIPIGKCVFKISNQKFEPKIQQQRQQKTFRQKFQTIFDTNQNSHHAKSIDFVRKIITPYIHGKNERKRKTIFGERKVFIIINVINQTNPAYYWCKSLKILLYHNNDCGNTIIILVMYTETNRNEKTKDDDQTPSTASAATHIDLFNIALLVVMVVMMNVLRIIVVTISSITTSTLTMSTSTRTIMKLIVPMSISLRSKLNVNYQSGNRISVICFEYLQSISSDTIVAIDTSSFLASCKLIIINRKISNFCDIIFINELNKIVKLISELIRIAIWNHYIKAFSNVIYIFIVILVVYCGIVGKQKCQQQQCHHRAKCRCSSQRQQLQQTAQYHHLNRIKMFCYYVFMYPYKNIYRAHLNLKCGMNNESVAKNGDHIHTKIFCNHFNLIDAYLLMMKSLKRTNRKHRCLLFELQSSDLVVVKVKAPTTFMSTITTTTTTLSLPIIVEEDTSILKTTQATTPTTTTTTTINKEEISLALNGTERRPNAACNRHSSNNIYLKKHLYLLLIAFLTCVPFASATMHNMKYSTNLVKTKYGQLRGIVVRSNPTVEAYLGVPYATPPVGSLRYMPPVTPSTWKNTRLADRFSPVCPQLPPVTPTGPEALLEIPRERLAQIRRLLPLLANQSEDCLYLNLYVPRTDEDPHNTGVKSLATIVYIHGESFEWNSGNPYDGSILAAHGNIIVVTINFRLGVLGFLKTGAKGSAQGNFGLMDLVAGLHWLRENLPSFNGDPSKVTLMGHGTGATLANILIVSPVASDLIRRGILFSGSALSPWAIQKDPLYIKRKVAEHTGCHGDLVEDDLAPCLRTKTVSELLSVPLQLARFLPGFAPFVDGTVIVTPGNSLTSPLTLPLGTAIASTLGSEMADFAKRELLFGLTTFESYLDLSAQDLEFGFNETRRDRILRTYVRNVYFYHLNEIYSALKNEYTDWERPPRNPLGSRDAALELLSDGHTAAPLVRLGYLHSLRGGRSYFMHFKHQSNERDFPQRSGSVRGEDVPFSLGLPISPLFPHNYTKTDIKISRTMVQYLSNFAHTGNPNETPPSSLHISHIFKHNHIASPIETSNTLTDTIDESKSHKQKRQMNLVTIHRRNKRNHDSYETDEDDEEEFDENDETNENYDGVEKDNHDRLDDTTNNQQIPFWDAYDSVNQLYLQVGNKIEIKNHYRGHKLSMWLSLIPQLHMPGDLTELAMRHHHFTETDKRFYDEQQPQNSFIKGIVRDQNMQLPILPKPPEIIATPVPKPEIIVITSTTDCPSNTTVTPTLAATRPQHNVAHSSDNSPNNNDNFLRRLTNTHFQSYSTALTVTIVVGCFLLLLNILIFAGIYYQREKRANDAKKKEELTEAESHCSPNSINRRMETRRKKSLQNVAGFNPIGNFGEYSCYDEKISRKEKHLLADICSVEIPMQELKCSVNGTDSNTSSLRRSVLHTGNDSFKHNILNQSNNTLLLYPPTYSSPHPPASISEAGSSNSSDLVTYHQFQHLSAPPTTDHCNQSTQSDIPDVHDVGTTVMEHEVDEIKNCSSKNSMGHTSTDTMLPATRSTTPYQGGILRQQGGPTTPSASKKRVQIQEISV